MTSSTRKANFHANYRGDCTHMVGEVVGPTTYRQLQVAVDDTFDGWERRALQAHGVRLAAAVRQQAGRWDKEHVLLVEGQIGRKLAAGEQVHHINTIKDDNDLENLFLCASSQEHQAAHSSFDALLPGLLADGVVIFDRAEGRYRRA